MEALSQEKQDLEQMISNLREHIQEQETLIDSSRTQIKQTKESGKTELNQFKDKLQQKILHM